MNVDAAKIRDFLQKEYGICNDDDFEQAVKTSKGIDIGLFTLPFVEVVNNDGNTRRGG